MTMHGPPNAAPTAAEHAAYGQGYERMRRHAVEPGTVHGRHASAVVALRGVAAWLHAFAELPAPIMTRAAAVCAGPPPGPLPTGVETPAIDILIAMLNGHMGRAAA